MKNIIFTNTANIPLEYAPKPAKDFIPEWYKKIESRFPVEKTPESLSTIKKCIPVFDAITAGYIIVSPCDVYVSMKDGKPTFKSSYENLISNHPRRQGYSHPGASEFDFPKWLNPWAITTPKGYSCLFISPLHRDNKWFTILDGVVDTDTYTASVNFPFVIKPFKNDFMIPSGTPIVQVIPFKRDNWKSSLNENLQSNEKTLRLLKSIFFDGYKKLFWNRKSYQ